MFKILLVKNDASRTYNITPIVERFSWDSELSLMSVMEFTVIWNDTRFFPKNPVENGDLVMIMKDDEEVNRGIVVTKSQNGREPISYIAYDYAWYLGKSKIARQFNKVTAKQAIEQILNEFGMLIGNIIEMNTVINKIYIEQTPAEIIRDIMKQHEQQSGVKLNAELRKGKIYIERMRDMVINGTFRLSENTPAYDVLSNPLEASRTESIVDMRNRVKIILTKDDTYETKALEQDASMISHYGLLEETFSIDEEDAAKARQVAKILLKRLSRVQETNNLKLMGDVAFKAGRLFDVVEPITGMSGRFMISSCKHEVEGNLHVMSLDLVLPEDVA